VRNGDVQDDGMPVSANADYARRAGVELALVEPEDRPVTGERIAQAQERPG
jgi:hypothetical protein